MGISKEAVRHFKSAMEAIDEEMKELGPLLDEAYAKRNSNIKQKSEDSDQKQPPDNGKLSDEDIANAVDTLVKNVPEITWSGGKK